MTDVTSSVVTGLAPTDAVSAVAAALAADGGLSDESFEKLVDLMQRFAAFAMTGRGVGQLRAVSADLVRDFVVAPNGSGDQPSVRTMEWRRTAVRLLFRIARQLGLATGDPTLDITLPRRPSSDCRPLTDEEVHRCRAAALHRLDATRLPAAWALAEATVRTSELADITIGDVHVEEGRVSIRGGPSTLPRLGFLTEWGKVQVVRRLRLVGGEPERPVVYEGNGSAKSRQASSCIAISVTMVRAGLGDDASARPASVAAWAGRQVLAETGRIDIVAARLGISSLDRAARFIGFEWLPTVAC